MNRWSSSEGGKGRAMKTNPGWTLDVLGNHVLLWILSHPFILRFFTRSIAGYPVSSELPQMDGLIITTYCVFNRYLWLTDNPWGTAAILLNVKTEQCRRETALEKRYKYAILYFKEWYVHSRKHMRPSVEGRKMKSRTIHPFGLLVMWFVSRLILPHLFLPAHHPFAHCWSSH